MTDPDFNMISIQEWIERFFPNRNETDSVSLSPSVLEAANRQMIRHAFLAGRESVLEETPPKITRSALIQRDFQMIDADTLVLNPIQRGYIRCHFDPFGDFPHAVFVIFKNEVGTIATIDNMIQMEALIQAFVVNK